MPFFPLLNSSHLFACEAEAKDEKKRKRQQQLLAVANDMPLGMGKGRWDGMEKRIVTTDVCLDIFHSFSFFFSGFIVLILFGLL